MSAFGWLLDRGPRRRPRPHVEIELDRAVPAWALRGVAGAVVVLGVAPLLDDWVTPLLLAALVVVLTHPATVAGLALLAGAVVLLGEPDLRTTAVLALVLHLLLVLVRLAAPLPPTGRVELRLLGRAFATFAVIQLITQAMVGMSFAAMEAQPRLAWPAVAVLAALAAAVVAAIRWVGRNTE
jgi:hypothetical protein